MADDKLRIEAVFDGTVAVRGIEQLGERTEQSMRRATQATEQMARSVEKVGNAAKVSASQVMSTASAFAGLAGNVVNAWAESNGQQRTVNTLQTIGGSAIAGAQAGAAFGPWGALIGGVGGAALGAGTAYFMSEAEARKEAERKSATTEALTDYDSARAETEAFNELLGRLANTARDASLRATELDDAIKSLEDESASARQAYASANAEGDTKGVAEAFGDIRTADARLDRLRALRRAGLPEDEEDDTPEILTADRQRSTSSTSDALTKLGIFAHGGGMDSATSSYQRDSLQIARQSLEQLKSISSSSKTATFA